MMKKFLNKKVLSFLFLVSVLTLIIAVPVFAENINEYIEILTINIRRAAIVFIALAACTTAILYMVGSVNPKVKDKGKDALYALIIGVIILVFSNDIANWIGDITGRHVDKDSGNITQSQSY